MTKHPMKPETLARRMRERVLASRERREALLERLREKASTEGPDSLWAELLEEEEGRSS